MLPPTQCATDNTFGLNIGYSRNSKSQLRKNSVHTNNTSPKFLIFSSINTTILATIFIITGPSTFLHYFHSIFFKQISSFKPLPFKMTFNPCGHIVMSHTGTRMHVLTAMAWNQYRIWFYAPPPPKKKGEKYIYVWKKINK